MFLYSLSTPLIKPYNPLSLFFSNIMTPRPFLPFQSPSFLAKKNLPTTKKAKRGRAKMKVQCDGCGIEAASVFCCADEAALCDNCDHRVHKANKVANKHRRFSLLTPSPSSSSSSSSSSSQQPPLCDICQEKRGFVFCKEDRAILCRDCDVPIHTSSDQTMKHSRYLLTGLRLSSSPIPSSSNPSETREEEEEVEKQSTNQCNSYHNKAISQDEAVSSASNNGSSISNYLINMLPGWHVEHLLNDEVASSAYANATASSGASYQEEMNPNGYGEGFQVWDDQQQGYYQGFAQKEIKVQKELGIFVPQMQNEWGQMPSSYYWT